MEGQEGRYVGIDLAKRSYTARIEPSGEGKAKILMDKTDEKGLEKLYGALGSEDRVALECCALGFWLAKQLMTKVGCEVFVLNAGQLAIIYKSTKKTDLNDSQKLAWILRRMPAEELPIVSLPSEEEERRRALVSELHSKKKLKTRLVNRLHSLYVREGRTDLRRKDMATRKAREKNMELLSERGRVEARRLMEEIDLFECHIQDIESEMAVELEGDSKAELLLTMPGVGFGTATAFLAHVGDGERFMSARQVSNFVGMTPRVYASGQTVRMGKISKRGCTAIRSVIVQSAWAAVHAKRVNVFKTKYQELAPRIGKKRAIVAIARRMLETMWILVTRNEPFRGYDESQKRLKLRTIHRKILDRRSAA